MEKQKIFIAGQIVGIPFSVARKIFNSTAEILAAQGFDVINPMDLDVPAGSSWTRFMAAGVAALIECDRIYMIDGWELANESRVEYKVAHEMRIPVTFETSNKAKDAKLQKVEVFKEAIAEILGQPFEYMIDGTDRLSFWARMIMAHHCMTDLRMKSEDVVPIINRQQSTVLYSSNKYRESMKYDPEFRLVAEAVKKNIFG